MNRFAPIAFAALGLATALAALADDGSYLRYLETAAEFRRVAPATAGNQRWDTWIYMPWRYRWTIGTGGEGGRFLVDHGMRGGVADHGRGPLDWFTRYGLRFYGDHSAGKGGLHLVGIADGPALRDPRAVRARPLDARLGDQLKTTLAANVRALRDQPLRLAYALDDEASWGVLTRPVAWRLSEDDGAYQRWLDVYYGAASPRAQFVAPDAMFAQLDRPLAAIDFSPLLDRLSYNDSAWTNLIGDLVEHANRIDPGVPCGLVGAQAPSAWGGYDYAKLMKKVQYIEVYDLGSAPAIARALADPAGIPIVSTHFHRPGAEASESAAEDRWQAWYRFAQGDRGMIGWVEGWFDSARPRPWLANFAPAVRALGEIHGPKLRGARWIHDGVAIYYSHPSIQVSWLLDSEAHGSSWFKRNEDHRLGTAALTRRAWERMLTDSGLQFEYIGYDEVARDGVPEEFRALILPACYALSDVEAARIGSFVERGGTLVADFACGLFDQHGRGRRSGALDAVFGVRHDGTERRRDFFSGDRWVETDQDQAYGYRRLRELLDTSRAPRRDRFVVPERRLGAATSRAYGSGRAAYLNLSPLAYLLYREEGNDLASDRQQFLAALSAAGVKPWLAVRPDVQPGGLRVESTYWFKGGRTYVFVTQAPEMEGDAIERRPLLRGTASDLVVELVAPIADVVDERSGVNRGDGRSFRFRFEPAEAVVFSFRGEPPRSPAR